MTAAKDPISAAERNSVVQELRNVAELKPVKKDSPLWARTKRYVPILEWLPKYQLKRDFKYDLVAGITVAMMLIPQEVSLAGIMKVPVHHGLYTAATAPLVYALFGSSTVLSVASGSEVSLLVGTILTPIKDEKERVATGIVLAFFSGVILLLVRILGLSPLADFFSRPVMGGFISAGGFLIMLSQVQNWLSLKIDHAPYPPQVVYKIFKNIAKTEMHAFWVGTASIIFLVSLRVIKKRYFRNAALSDLFDEPVKTKEAEEELILSPVQAQAPPTAHHSHAFSLTDAQYFSMETARAAAEPQNEEEKKRPKSKIKALLLFTARTMCDLGPLIVCIAGGIVGYSLGPKKIKVTGHVPGGFPAPVEPWYGFYDLIGSDRVGDILLNALTVAVVVYLSSIAMAKRLAIQRGEDIRTQQELTGIGVASIVCGIFQAMPPTGGMSRTAVNLQNARTQVASIVTTILIIISLYTLTGTLYYLPKASLAAIIIVAGYSLVEFKEAKWLYRVKRDEFYVWTASFVLTLGLGVLQGLIASIISSVLALMYKTKRPPVIILGELDNGGLVDRDLYPNAKPLHDVLAIRVESSLYFANCEGVVDKIDNEIRELRFQGIQVRGVVLDAAHMNDIDATTIQVLSDMQEKLAVKHIKFAIANANDRLHGMISATTLIKRILANDATININEAVRVLRMSPPSAPSSSRNTVATSPAGQIA